MFWLLNEGDESRFDTIRNFIFLYPLCIHSEFRSSVEDLTAIQLVQSKLLRLPIHAYVCVSIRISGGIYRNLPYLLASQISLTLDPNGDCKRA